MLNLNQLRSFYEVLKCGGFGRAAQRLNVTQPAVTAQVKLLEKECGYKLVVRKRHSVLPTEEGKVLFAEAKKIFDAETQVENAIEELRKVKRGNLPLGSARTYKKYFLPYIIKSFHTHYPNIKVVLEEGSSLEMLQALHEKEIQLAIISSPWEHEKVHLLPLCCEELFLICSPGHPLAKKDMVSVKELADEPLIMKERGSGTRERVEDLFNRNHVGMNIRMETSDAETIKKLVELGEGLSFLVKMAVKQELERKSLHVIRLAEERLILDIALAYLKNSDLSPSARAFLDLMADSTTESVPYPSMDRFVCQLARK